MTVRGDEPAAAFAGRDRVSVEASLELTPAGLKTALTPGGSPDTDSETWELNPLIGEMLTVYEAV